MKSKKNIFKILQDINNTLVDYEEADDNFEWAKSNLIAAQTEIKRATKNFSETEKALTEGTKEINKHFTIKLGKHYFIKTKRGGVSYKKCRVSTLGVPVILLGSGSFVNECTWTKTEAFKKELEDNILKNNRSSLQRYSSLSNTIVTKDGNKINFWGKSCYGPSGIELRLSINPKDIQIMTKDACLKLNSIEPVNFEKLLSTKDPITKKMVGATIKNLKFE